MRKLQPAQWARLLRRVAAMASLAMVTAYVVCAGTSLALKLQWIEKAQIVPAVFAGAFAMLVFWAAFTLIFGRVYCSLVCPMGVMMDIFARLPRLKKRSKPYSYAPPRNALRYSFIAVYVLGVLASLTLVVSTFDPYSAFASIVSCSLSPLIDAGGREVVGVSVATAVTTTIVFAAVAVASVMRGRILCNTICPVGAALSLLSRYSMYGIDINTDVCIGCNRCVDVCKAQCINPADHTVDNSRCVVCLNCTADCPTGAINYTSRRHRLSTPLMLRTRPPRIADCSTGPNTSNNLRDHPTQNDETISPTP